MMDKGDVMKAKFVILAVLYSAVNAFLANSFVLIRQFPHILYALVPVFVWINLFAGVSLAKHSSIKMKLCHHGTVLLYIFCISMIPSAAYQIYLAFQTIPHDHLTFVWSLLTCIGVHFLVFWNGIVCVYLTSAQLGMKLRILGIICGMIPVLNLIVLFLILKTTTGECMFELHKEQINKQRKDQQLCATRYPILLVHGVFFRDNRFFNYWGRIPKELEVNGAKIFYGNHPSAASIADSAEFLKDRILQILAQTGAEKVNIIAHSKGGLDCRYAIAKLGMAEYVASLTTVNTPHKGCLFADYLLTKIPEDIQNNVAQTYNSALKRFGEKDADFLAAVNDLTDSHCRALDNEMPTPVGIFCQSVGSVLAKASGGKFPLNFSYHLVKHFSGENDGLVSEDSFAWGENYILLRPSQNRGISHGDVIDLNRSNIPGFDVRDFYVNLVNTLKTKGL